MRKLYSVKIHSLFAGRIVRTCKIACLVLVALFTAQSVFAQVTLNWTGLVSSDATDPANWEPQQAIASNILVIDSAYKFTNQPVFSGSANLAIANLTIRPTGQMTIAFTDSIYQLEITQETPTLWGTINIDHGKLRMRRVEIEDTNTVINVTSGGILEVRKYLFFGGAGNPAFGGFLNVEGTGYVVYTAEQAQGGFGRFPDKSEPGGIMKVSPYGRIDLKGDYRTALASLIDSAQLVSDPDYDIVVKYYAATNWTKITCRHKMAFVVEPPEPQFLITNEVGEKIGVVTNDAWAATTTFEWKFTTTSGSGYQSFSPAETNDTLEPVFTVPGRYYVVCTGDGDARISNEVIFYVGSDLLSVSPSTQQYLRPGMEGAMLTVTKDASITGVEWKWSNTPGADYVSFEPPATADEFTPVFNDPGSYYVSCIGTDGTNSFPSKDVLILVDNATYVIDWKGIVDNSPHKAENWLPHANIPFNILRVGDPTTYTNQLVFEDTGSNDTINNILLNAAAEVTVNKGVDTLHISKGGNYDLLGTMVLESGAVSYSDLRLEDGTVTVNGGEFIVRSSYFMLSNSGLTKGGFVNISGNGKFTTYGNLPDRFSTDPAKSIITITGNGLMQVTGDWTAGAQTQINNGHLVTDAENMIVVEYDMARNMTYISSRSLTAFGITPEENQYVEVGEEISKLSVVNNTGITSYVWKYSTDRFGEYVPFEPAQTGDTLQVTFASAGDYYILCEGSDGTNTYVSNKVGVRVLSTSIEPAGTQYIVLAEEGMPITVTESAIPASREWLYSTTPGSGYVSLPSPVTTETYTPMFAQADTFYIVCASTFGTKTIYSNEVAIIVLESVTVSIAPEDEQVIKVGQDGTALTVAEAPEAQTREWMYATESGGTYNAFEPVQTGASYTPNFTAAGIYYVVCVSSLGVSQFTSNEVAVKVVSVDIAPTADQRIEATKDGTPLTVTESPAADSREWKYGTAVGGPYSSFSTPQTGTSYTPNFATAGVYYVVCVSKYGSVEITSNEVKIDARPLGIETPGEKMFNLYPNPAVNRFYLDAGELTNYNIEVRDLLGRTVLVREFRGVSGPQEITLDKKGIFFVHLRSGNKTQNVKLILK